MSAAEDFAALVFSAVAFRTAYGVVPTAEHIICFFDFGGQLEFVAVGKINFGFIERISAVYVERNLTENNGNAYAVLRSAYLNGYFASSRGGNIQIERGVSGSFSGFAVNRYFVFGCAESGLPTYRAVGILYIALEHAFFTRKRGAVGVALARYFYGNRTFRSVLNIGEFFGKVKLRGSVYGDFFAVEKHGVVIFFAHFIPPEIGVLEFHVCGSGFADLFAFERSGGGRIVAEGNGLNRNGIFARRKFFKAVFRARNFHCGIVCYFYLVLLGVIHGVPRENRSFGIKRKSFYRGKSAVEYESFAYARNVARCKSRYGKAYAALNHGATRKVIANGIALAYIRNILVYVRVGGVAAHNGNSVARCVCNFIESEHVSVGYGKAGNASKRFPRVVTHGSIGIIVRIAVHGGNLYFILARLVEIEFNRGVGSSSLAVLGYCVIGVGDFVGVLRRARNALPRNAVCGNGYFGSCELTARRHCAPTSVHGGIFFERYVFGNGIRKFVAAVRGGNVPAVKHVALGVVI